MAAIDKISDNTATRSAGGAAAITPNDGTDLVVVSKALFIGGAGNLTVTMLDGVDAVFTGVTAGQLLPIRVTRVKATGTTCTNITSMY